MGGGVGDRSASRSWDSSFCLPIFKGSEEAPGQFQRPRLAHHFTLHPPSIKLPVPARPSSLDLQRVWLARPWRLNIGGHSFFPVKGEEGSTGCLPCSFPQVPALERSIPTLGTWSKAWEEAQETGIPLLLSRQLYRAEGLSLDRFWLGQHLPGIADPIPHPIPPLPARPG